MKKKIRPYIANIVICDSKDTKEQTLTLTEEMVFYFIFQRLIYTLIVLAEFTKISYNLKGFTLYKLYTAYQTTK